MRSSCRPALVLRTELAHAHGPPLPTSLSSHVIACPEGQGPARDAACVVVKLVLPPSQAEVYRAGVRSVDAVRRECEICGMQNNSMGGWRVDGNIDLFLPLVRQAAELGADIL